MDKLDQLKDISRQLKNLQVAVDNLIAEMERSKKRKKIRELLRSMSKVSVKPAEAPVVPNYEIAESFFKSRSRMERFLDMDDVPELVDDKDVSPKSSRSNHAQASFEDKLRRKAIDEFNAADLVRYFRYCAQQNGIRYVISNWGKEVSQMKRLMKQHGGEFTNEEIITMIEFIFNSDQTYLDKRRTGIGIFTTNWLNKIFQDSQDWIRGEYSEQRKPATTRPREWSGSKKSTVEIGGLE